ncbi:MAG: hypothetical protein GY866_28425 [Proteobacteria bacterium]|nr:hypothetical protein [Pseudomonadota bacterium]
MDNRNKNKIKKIKVVRAEGSYYEIGYAIGKETKNQIQRILQRKSFDEKNKSIVAKEYRAFLRYIEPYPSIMDELKGLADGSETDLESIVKLNIVELDRKRKHQDDCSSFIIKNDDTFLLAHNEDGREGDDIFLLRAVYPSGTEILSFCYYGSLVGFSVNLNSFGLTIMCNALFSNDVQLGEPKRVFARRLVECKTIDEAIGIIKTSKRSQGQHFTFKQFDRVVGVETSATSFQTREITENYYHCNNFIFPEMLEYDAFGKKSGFYMRTLEAEKIFQSLSDINEVKKVLSSHKNNPNCFCAHGAEKGDYSKTLGSIFLDCIKKQIWIGYGPTCRTELECVQFDPFFDSAGQENGISKRRTKK